MSSDWEPHGLIKTEWLEGIYQGCRDDDIEPMQLLEDLFNKQLFHSPGFTVNSRVPLSKTNSKRGIIIHSYGNDASQKDVLCFVQCEASSNTTASEIKKLEEQIICCAEEYFNDPANQNVTLVNACTAVGVHIRLWRYQREAGLQGLWGDHELGVWKHYKDIGDDKHTAEIEENFQLIRGTAPEHEGPTIQYYFWGEVNVDVRGDRSGKSLFHYSFHNNLCTDLPTAWKDWRQSHNCYVNTERLVWTRRLPPIAPLSTRHVQLTCMNHPTATFYVHFLNGQPDTTMPIEWKHLPGEQGVWHAKKKLWSPSLPANYNVPLR